MNNHVRKSAGECVAGLIGTTICAAILLQSTPARSDSATEADPETARGYTLESEIEVELRRQEELFRAIERNEQAKRDLDAFTLRAEDLSERADTRIAPRAPRDRELPIAIFDSEISMIAPGAWNNDTALAVIRRSLDADRDGKPEQIRYFDESTGVLIRKEEDLDFDGTIDSWKIYSDGKLVERLQDTDRDGRTDVWESYRNERMTRRAIDRNDDGVEDAVYIFVGNSLVEERHDRNGDGIMDVRSIYEDGKLIRREISNPDRAPL